jgi:hypothetical protein
MRKAGVLLLLLTLLTGGALSAQEGEAPIESDWDIYAPEFYSRGDQTFIISLGVVMPAIFLSQGSVIQHNISPPVGGTGSLSYNYFLTSHISVGGEIGGIFAPTVAENVLYIIPVGLRLGYQFIFRRFEFPLTITAGIAPLRYLEQGYAGLFVKAGAALYYRFNPDWSFGVNANWYWIPQWVKDSSKNVDGNIVDITVAARYHF